MNRLNSVISRQRSVVDYVRDSPLKRRRLELDSHVMLDKPYWVGPRGTVHFDMPRGLRVS